MRQVRAKILSSTNEKLFTEIQTLPDDADPQEWGDARLAAHLKDGSVPKDAKVSVQPPIDDLIANVPDPATRIALKAIAREAGLIK